MEKIFNEFLRKETDLMKYMNAYSMTLRKNISNEDFARLFDVLAEINAKYETIPEKEQNIK